MTPAEFEARLNELLDERRDPLADDECVAFLAAHPAGLDAYTTLHERLAALPRQTAAQPWAKPWLLFVAAAAVLLSAAWWASGVTADARPRTTGRVLAASSAPASWNPGAATPALARSVLLASPHAHLEVFEQW
jgi:hypothetical protein